MLIFIFYAAIGRRIYARIISINYIVTLKQYLSIKKKGINYDIRI